ncbi:PAS domain S-box protein [Candidatus Bipolaricaulota bacterium]|nr:PAS domain S-box protein [Candidatus Bipolaricaulota bacterium]
MSGNPTDDENKVLQSALITALLGSCHDVAILVKPNGIIITASPGMAQLLGVTREQAIGRNLRELLDAETFAQLGSWFEKALQAKSTLEFVDERDGRCFSNRMTPILDKKGGIWFVAVFITDITSEARARKELERSESRYRALIEGADSAIAIIDRNGVFRFMNLRGAEPWGMSPEQANGKTMHDLFPPEIAAQQLDSIQSVLASGNCEILETISVVAGERRWYRTSLCPLPNQEEIPSVLVVATDITELRTTHIELRQMVETNQRRMALVAHEILNPLTSIRGSLDLLEAASSPDRENDEAYERAMSVVDRSVLRIQEFVNSFLDFDRINQRIGNSRWETVCLEDIVASIEDVHGPIAEQRGLVLRTEVRNPLQVRGDRDLLERVVSNLVVNAIHHTTQGEIRVVLRPVGAFAAIDVIDTGEGIPEEELPHLFEPFFRGASSRRAGADQGFGLGLPIASSIVEDHRGSIRVTSEPCKGSRFTVLLPTSLRPSEDDAAYAWKPNLPGQA